MIHDDISNAITSGIEWIYNSGIQNIDTEPKEEIGGVSAWYDVHNGQWGPLYEEISGYTATFLLNYYNITGDIQAIQRAQLSVDWLVSPSVFLRLGGGSQEEHKRISQLLLLHPYAFDTGICLNSIIYIYRVTKREIYVEKACKLADWLINTMLRSDGSLEAIQQIGNKPSRTRFISDPSKWSSQSGPYHAKTAIGLINLSMITGDNRYRRAAERLCYWVIENRQLRNGRFITEWVNGSTFTHSHCYAMEGLVAAGILLSNSDFIQAALDGLRWITENQLETGGVPAYYKNGSFDKLESPDITSQVIRLVVLSRYIDQTATDAFDLELSIRRILQAFSDDVDQKSRGGVIAGPAWFANTTSDTQPTHVNTWVTLFTLQALQLYKNTSYAESFDYTSIV